jgi:hypothetical protein
LDTWASARAVAAFELLASGDADAIVGGDTTWTNRSATPNVAMTAEMTAI